jgi:thiol-disulfide isomerase/thioredoxin
MLNRSVLRLGLRLGLMAITAAGLLFAGARLSASRAGDAPLTGAVADFNRIDPPLPAPGAAFRDSAGKELHLADFRGKVVLLNVWATWCAPCRAEMPSLDRLQAKLGGEGLLVLPLSLDRGGGPVVAVYYGQHGITHLGVYLSGQGGLQNVLKIGGVPTSFLIDRAGRIVGRLEGATQWDSPEALELIRSYLETKAPLPTQPADFHPAGPLPAGKGAGDASAQRVGVGLSPL